MSTRGPDFRTLEELEACWRDRTRALGRAYAGSPPVGEPWFDRSEVVPAWQDFLAKRAYVHSEGLRLAKQEEHEANRYNPDYWRGTPGTGYDAL